MYEHIPLNSLFRKTDQSEDDMFLHGIKILSEEVCRDPKTKKQRMGI